MKDYVVDLTAPPAIIETDTRRSDEVRKRLQQLDSTLTLDTFQRGDLLSEVKANSFWRDWRFKSFPEYLKESAFDITPRQAEYEILISDVSKQLGIGLVEKSRAKNSKLKVIYELDPNDTYTDSATHEEESMADIMRKLVADAPNKTLKEIKDLVKKLKGEEDEDDEFDWFPKFPLKKGSKKVLMLAVENIIAQSGSTLDVMTKEEKQISIGIAFERLAADWLSDPNNTSEDFDEQGGDFEDSHDDSEDEPEFEDDEE